MSKLNISAPFTHTQKSIDLTEVCKRMAESWLEKRKIMKHGKEGRGRAQSQSPEIIM